MFKKYLKLLGSVLEPIGKKNGRTLGGEKHKIVGKIYVDKNNKVIVDSKNKKIKEQLQKELDKRVYQNKFYIEKDDKKFYKKPSDPLFLEALRQSSWFWASQDFDGYGLLGFFGDFPREKNMFDKILFFIKGGSKKKIKIIESKTEQSGEEIKETIGEIYVDKNNNVIVKSKNKKIKERLQSEINKMVHTEKAIYLRTSDHYLREDGSVEDIETFLEFKKPGEVLFLEALKKTVLNYNRKINNHILIFSLVEE